MDFLTRYDRQIRLDRWNQSYLSNARVLVAGVGALGCEVAKNLALMGVGELLLVDNDVIELSNLSRQMLYTDQDISKPKAIIAEERIRNMNPLVKVHGIQSDVRKIPEEVFGEVDVVVGAVDNWPTRRWLNSMAMLTKKPFVDIATDGYYGNVQVVVPYKTSCLECHADVLIPEEIQASECSLRRREPHELVSELAERGITITLTEAEQLFKHNVKTVYDIKFVPQSVLDGMDRRLSELVIHLRGFLSPKMPALQSVSATVSGLGAFEVVRILHKGVLGNSFNGLMVFDGLTARLTRVKLEKNPNCHVCGSDPDKPFEIEVSKDETIADVKERISNIFKFPDPKVQLGRKLLEDNLSIPSSGMKDGDIIYIHSSRRATVVPVRVRLVEAGH